jgi:multiple sugar transport system permease protein
MMLSPAVMGLYWAFILNGQYGVLNQILSLLFVSQPQWLTDPDLKLISMLIVDTWM